MLCGLLVGCAALDGVLDKMVTVTSPETGETSEVAVGDIVAETATGAGDIIGSVVGMATGNPLAAGGAAALAAALLAGARRKKAAVAVESTEA